MNALLEFLSAENTFETTLEFRALQAQLITLLKVTPSAITLLPNPLERRISIHHSIKL